MYLTVVTEVCHAGKAPSAFPQERLRINLREVQGLSAPFRVTLL